MDPTRRCSDRRLGEVIDHQCQARMTLGEGRHDPQQVLRFGAHVERQVALGEQCQHIVDLSGRRAGRDRGRGERDDARRRSGRSPSDRASALRPRGRGVAPNRQLPRREDLERGEVEHHLGVVVVVGCLNEDHGDDSCSVQFVVDVA